MKTLRFVFIPALMALFLNPASAQDRFASAVLAVSSEYGSPQYSAAQTLGPPNVYPAYGDNANAWASKESDGGREYITLALEGTAASVNYVRIWQTYGPGAVDTVYVRNAQTRVWEKVWRQTALPELAPNEARSTVLQAVFPRTAYPVDAVRIALDTRAVPGWSEIDAVAAGYDPGARRPALQRAAGVLAFSSQYGTDKWSANQVVGAPNVYPTYGDNSGAWASKTTDGSREFLELRFDWPMRASFVQIYETLNPGAVDTVYVFNPETGRYQIVWSAPAQEVVKVARIFEARFPLTAFETDRVRLALNSPAVPGWNEIDAVYLGEGTATSAERPADDLPARFDLSEAYPNPFNPSTRFTLTLTEAGPVSIAVFDVLGRPVARLHDGRLSAGVAHTFTFDASGLPSGLYFYRAAGTNFQATRRVVLLK